MLTDSKWLAFVLEQLLTNAIKYTPERGRIALRLEGRTLLLQDSGIGIRAEDLPRIFEKGFTGCNGREEQHSTGLGLYLCRRILDKLGHPIRISSTLARVQGWSWISATNTPCTSKRCRCKNCKMARGKPCFFHRLML